MLDIKSLARLSVVKQYPAGSVILREHAKGEEMFILLQGTVEVFKGYGGANSVLLDSITAGDIFGEAGLFCGTERTATVVAKELATAAIVNKNNFQDFISANGKAIFQIMETLCNRVAKLDERLGKSESEREKLFELAGIDRATFYRSLLFPKGHKTYGTVAPETFSTFLFPRAYTCPHCDEVFQGVMQLSSKIRPIGDMSCSTRRHWHDFEPLWYDVLTCPSCYFSTLESLFTPAETFQKKKFQNKLVELKDGLSLAFHEPRDIDQVFTSYYFALICAEGSDKVAQIKAKLWLSLSWLYEDVGDDAMLQYARQQAFDHTWAVFSAQSLPPERSQTMQMVLGTLARKLGRTEDALLHLTKVRHQVDGKSVYQRLAEVEMDEIREERRGKDS